MTEYLETQPRGRYPKPDDFEPVPGWNDGHRWENDTNRLRCQAWNVNLGRQCENQAMTRKGKDKCRVHGGKTPVSGIGHPGLVHGKYSKALPMNLREIYEDAKANPELLALEDEIALLDARLIDLLGKVDVEGGTAIFKRLRGEMAKFDEANALASRLAGDQTAQRRALAEAASHLNNVRQFINDGNREASIWHDIQGTIELRRRLSESERKIMIDARMLVNTESVLIQVEEFVTEVISIVRDPEQLRAIRNAYHELPLLNG